MPILESRIDTRSEAFQANRQAMLAMIKGFRTHEARVREASEARRPVFRQRGQMTPRERIALLLDRGSTWLEISTLAGFGMHDDDGAMGVQGGLTICGIGLVSGVRCMVMASDSGIKGGVITPMGLRKTLRVQQIAQECKLPLIRLVESGGANLLHQSEIFVEGGRIFAMQARMSAAGIPQVTVVNGSSRPLEAKS